MSTAGGADVAPAAAGPSGALRPQRAAAGSAEVHTLPPSERHAQYAEIREMIAQVQSDDGRAQPHDAHVQPPRGPSGAQGGSATAAAVVETPQRGEPARVDDAEEIRGALHQDPLRRRMAEHDARAARERAERERLRRSLRQRDTEASAGSGAFLTGFLLVLLIAATMLAIYLLHPRIIERFPESEAMLTHYVASIDDLRAEIAETYNRARAWVLELVARAG